MAVEVRTGAGTLQDRLMEKVEYANPAGDCLRQSKRNGSSDASPGTGDFVTIGWAAFLSVFFHGVFSLFTQ